LHEKQRERKEKEHWRYTKKDKKILEYVREFLEHHRDGN
jgi:hypothetical protein